MTIEQRQEIIALLRGYGELLTERCGGVKCDNACPEWERCAGLRCRIMDALAVLENGK